MLLEEIRKFRKQTNQAKLPLKLTLQSFVEACEKFVALAKQDEAIWEALTSEHKLQRTINERLATLATELGMPKLADEVMHNDFCLLYSGLCHIAQRRGH